MIEAIATIVLLGICVILALMLAGKYKMMFMDAEEEIKELQNEVGAAEMILKAVRQQMDETNQILIERELKLKTLAKFLQNGVFYDVENDTIVLAENLERLGDL